jgi:hypothetical protein
MDTLYHGGEEDCIYVTGGQTRKKETTRKQICRWEDNIRMVLGERGWSGIGCIVLVKDRDQWWAFVNMVINQRVP